MALLKKKSPDVLPSDLQGAEERLQQSDLVSPGAPAKKSPSPALLGGGAFALVALALGGWYMFGAKSAPPAEDDGAAPLTRSAAAPAGAPGAFGAPGAPAPGAPGAPKAPGAKPGAVSPAAKRAALRPRPGQNPGVAALKRAAVNRPGRVGQRPPGLPAGAPAFAPPVPGQLPRFVPVQGAPTPMQPPAELGGTPGRVGPRSDIVLTPVYAPAPAGQLKLLWNQGAAAKQRGDLAAARRAWGQILQASPNHPGIQEAIDKLGPA